MGKISEDAIIDLCRPLAVSPNTPLGLSDDCACLPFDQDRSLLVTTDSLVESVHFNREIAPRELGHKALAVSLSDIAAMGGDPQYATLSWSLPQKTTDTWVKQFLLGWRELADRFQVTLVGGDTTRANDAMFVNVTAIGVVPTLQMKRRSAAKVDDLVMVTGTLGDSRAGLELVLSGQEGHDVLLDRHFQPEPQVKAGQVLREIDAVHAMMDLSDGLAIDALRICKASGVGMRIDLESLPTSAELAAWALQRRVDAKDFSAAGGEDYQLLFTVQAGKETEIGEKLKSAGTTGTVIGKVVTGDQLQFCRDGSPRQLLTPSFQHFDS